MYSKDDLLQSIAHEMHVIKHLVTKVPEGGMEYRPTEKQRSTQELLQYLATIGSQIGILIQNENTDHFPEMSKKAQQLETEEQFHAALDAQLTHVTEIINQLDEDELEQEFEEFGMSKTKSQRLVDFLLKNLTAYRMQLFLYAKQAGNHDIGSMNARAGMDAPLS